MRSIKMRVAYSNELYHFGRKGQKWYVRNGPPYPLTSSQLSSSERNAKRLEKSVGFGKMDTSSLETVFLPKDEYAHVMAEIATHASNEQKGKSVFTKNVGSYAYTVENGFNGLYRVIRKREIDDVLASIVEGLLNED